MQDPRSINFSWLLTLRSWAVAGQLGLVLLVDLLTGIDLPLLAIAGIVGIEAISNVLCSRWAARGHVPEDWMLGALMAFDVILFTALLQLSGGPMNPFSFLYLVYIALAAVVLPPSWGWALAGFSLACFGGLFLLTPVHDIHAGHGDDLRLHLQGMWFAFAVAAAFIVYFVQRVTRALAAREAELQAARALTARHERLASLATLAAGAAHQLATPLATIAIAARELADDLGQRDGSGDAVSDAHLIREQVERCREILLQMAADAGESTGEPLVDVSVGELVERAVDGLAGRERLEVSIGPSAQSMVLSTPKRSVAQALRGVVKNAIEASPAPLAVALRAEAEHGALRVTVTDRGSGMSAAVLQHAGEPFFTTKGPDRGMGLGLFLTRAVVERLGGRMQLESRAGHGTTVALTIPARVDATIDRIGRQAGAAA
ncbi:MAG: ATP-binding protein [Deltaproteobacteria bacterium]|nr:ATP-binding protein [Deltaproteobacteria bacterium]